MNRSWKMGTGAAALVVVMAAAAVIIALRDEPDKTAAVSSSQSTQDVSEEATMTADPSPAAPPVTVQVDAAVRSDPPLLKKFSQYNSGIPPMSSYDRDLDALPALDPDSLRLDLGIGKDGYIATDAVTGEKGQLKYNFTNLDRLARMLNDRNVLPYYSWSYIPAPLQVDGDFRKGPTDWNAWEDIYEAYARHFKESGIRIGYHEVYNEPDLTDVFLSEPFDTYIKMYEYGAKGLKEGDPDAVVGGPAAAIPENRAQTQNFLDAVAKKNLPLDFFSFHEYWTGAPFWTKLKGVRTDLARDERFDTTEIHVNELSYVSGWQGKDSLNNRAEIGPHILDVIQDMLQAPDVTVVNWAQYMDSTFQDDSYGLIDKDGHKKAAYNVFKVYADMPEERVQSESDDMAVAAMASSDDHKASVVLWSKGESDQQVVVNLANLRFAKGRLQVYRIDKEHASYNDGAVENLAADEVKEEISTSGLQWSGVLPAHGVVYVTIQNGEAGDDFHPEARDAEVAQYVRSYYDFVDRSADNYAYWDRKSWKAYLGMGTQEKADSVVAVQAEKLPDRLSVSSSAYGKEGAQPADSRLGMRVDYEVNGRYVKSVAFREQIDPGEKTNLAWGTRKPPDKVVKVDDLASFEADLKKDAPNGWTGGKAILTFEMRNAGPGAGIEFKIR